MSNGSEAATLDIYCKEMTGANESIPTFQQVVHNERDSHSDRRPLEQWASAFLLVNHIISFQNHEAQPQRSQGFCLIKDQNKFEGQVVWLL